MAAFALHDALAAQDDALIDELLAERSPEAARAVRALVNRADSAGVTPLMVACCHHPAAVDRLLALGASNAPRLPSGNSAAHLAAQHGHARALTSLAATVAGSLLLPNKSGDTPVHMCCAAGGHSDALRAALDALAAAGVQRALAATNKHGDTPLLLACRSGAAACVVALLAAGADPFMRHGRSGDTPAALLRALVASARGGGEAQMTALALALDALDTAAREREARAAAVASGLEAAAAAAPSVGAPPASKAKGQQRKQKRRQGPVAAAPKARTGPTVSVPRGSDGDAVAAAAAAQADADDDGGSDDDDDSDRDRDSEAAAPVERSGGTDLPLDAASLPAAADADGSEGSAWIAIQPRMRKSEQQQRPARTSQDDRPARDGAGAQAADAAACGTRPSALPPIVSAPSRPSAAPPTAAAAPARARADTAPSSAAAPPPACAPCAELASALGALAPRAAALALHPSHLLASAPELRALSVTQLEALLALLCAQLGTVARELGGRSEALGVRTRAATEELRAELLSCSVGLAALDSVLDSVLAGAGGGAREDGSRELPALVRADGAAAAGVGLGAGGVGGGEWPAPRESQLLQHLSGTDDADAEPAPPVARAAGMRKL
jgi:ankyrin repeat protein